MLSVAQFLAGDEVLLGTAVSHLTGAEYHGTSPYKLCLSPLRGTHSIQPGAPIGMPAARRRAQYSIMRAGCVEEMPPISTLRS